jgi:lysophospholipase L1-like esterase
MKIFSRLILIIFGVVLACFLIEAGSRGEQYLRKGVPLLKNPNSEWDNELGWKGKEHIIKGETSTSPILVLGDSFTDGLGIPSEDMWFAKLKEISKGQDIIAYGGMGYGNLQELLVLKNYLAKGLKPSAIYLQLCTNDIINNSFELEKNSYLQRAPAPRPYLEDGQINLRFPRHYVWLMSPLLSYSRVVLHYNFKWEMNLGSLASERKINSIEYDIQKNGFNFPAFRSAISTTDTILSLIKEAAAKIPLYFVVVDNIEPNLSALKTSIRKKNIPLVVAPEIQPFLPTDRLEDGTHLNKEGNKKLGESVIKGLNLS